MNETLEIFNSLISGYIKCIAESRDCLLYGVEIARICPTTEHTIKLMKSQAERCQMAIATWEEHQRKMNQSKVEAP